VVLSSKPDYDVRSRALVELKGDATEQQALEEALSAQGWKVIKRWSLPGSSRPEQRLHHFYVLEVRFPGSRINARRGMKQQIERFGDIYSLNLEAHSPEGATYQNILVGASHADQDIEEVQRLLEAQGEQGEGSQRRKLQSLGAVSLLVAVAIWVAIFISVAIIEMWVLVCASLLVAVSVHIQSIRWVARVSNRGISRVFWQFAIPAGTLDAIAFWFGVAARRAPEVPLWFIPWFMIAGLIAAGLHLEFRRATWRTVLPWLVPVIAAFVTTLFPQFSVFWTAGYLHHFGFGTLDIEASPERVLGGIPPLFQLVCCILAVPAFLGTLRHFHVPFIDDRQKAVPYLTLLLVVILCWVMYLQIYSFREANNAQSDAMNGRAPAAFYGIKPKLVCVEPLEKPGDLSGEGWMINPQARYLHFGTAKGSAVLWSPHDGRKIIPADSVRLIETEKRNCTVATFTFQSSDFASVDRLNVSGKEKAVEVIRLVRERGTREISVYNEPARGKAGSAWKPARLNSLVGHLSGELGEATLVRRVNIDACDLTTCPTAPRLTVVVPGAPSHG